MNRCPHCGIALDEDPDPICPACNSALSTPPTATSVSAPKDTASDIPVGHACPNCSSLEYHRVRPDRWIAFRSDRICRDCETRYIPPTPRWAGLVFISIGLIMGSIGVIGFFLSLPGSSSVALIVSVFLGFLGLLSLIHGSQSLVYPGRI